MPESSFWSDLTKWDWLTLVGIALVFIGVFGEVALGIIALLKSPSPYPKYSYNNPAPMPTDLFFARAAWEEKDAKHVKTTHLLEMLAGSVLVLGLLLELLGFVPSLRQAWREKEMLRLGLSLSESNNLVLRSN